LPSRRTLAESARRAAARLQAHDEESAFFKTTNLNTTPETESPEAQNANGPTSDAAEAIADAAHSTDITGARSDSDNNENLDHLHPIKTAATPQNSAPEIVMDEKLSKSIFRRNSASCEPSPCNTAEN
jgi:hypothetical protein